MKTVKGILSLALVLVFALSLSGCAGIIPPAIGESAMSAAADTQAEQEAPLAWAVPFPLVDQLT